MLLLLISRKGPHFLGWGEVMEAERLHLAAQSIFFLLALSQVCGWGGCETEHTFRGCNNCAVTQAVSRYKLCVQQPHLGPWNWAEPGWSVLVSAQSHHLLIESEVKTFSIISLKH